MSEWVCFGLTAAGLIAALALMTAGVVGNCRFNSASNRIHAAGVGDSLGMALLTIALSVSAASFSSGARLFLPLLFLWVTSPVTSHFLALMSCWNASRAFHPGDRGEGGQVCR